MPGPVMSSLIKQRVQKAARALGAADPLPYVGSLIERTFPLPAGSPEYADNVLTPGAAPFEPSYSEREPGSLRFTLSPLTPDAPPFARRSEATHQMRDLVGHLFGRDALRWFDGRSEIWRSAGTGTRLHFGAWFGSSYEPDGLSAAKVYYEMLPDQLEALPLALKRLVSIAAESMPSLRPIFTSIRCGRDFGSQRITFQQRGPLALASLGPLLQRLGMGHQLSGIMQVAGLCLGGRFDLPANSCLIGLSESREGPEFKLEILLSMIPDLPTSFLELLRLALTERPRELSGLDRWLRAFTPDNIGWPGEFSVLSIRATPQSGARVSLYLRPVEFEIKEQMIGDALAATA